MTEIPDALRPLLEAPTFAHLATVHPDGAPQSSPMWFSFDGERVRFTHTRHRAKFRNLQANPGMAFSIVDPGNPYSYIEVRGVLDEVVPDPTGAFYVELSRRYGTEDPPPPPDAADRVVLVMRIERVLGR